MMELKNSKVFIDIMLYMHDKEICFSFTDIKKKVNHTYSFVQKILYDMEKKNFIKIREKGRIKIVVLTPKGRLIARNIFNYYRSLKDA